MVNGKRETHLSSYYVKTSLQNLIADLTIRRLEHQRSKYDKLVTIRDLWTMFLLQLKSCYIPGESLTVDEQLIPIRGRCCFRQYIPSKPEKYGLKTFWCCDSMTVYPLNGEVYLGRQSEIATTGNSMSRITNLVRRLDQQR